MDYQVSSCGMNSTACPVCKTGLSGPGATFVKAPRRLRTRKIDVMVLDEIEVGRSGIATDGDVADR